MRVVLINYGHLPRQHRPEEVLEDFETLTGWSDSLRTAGAEVIVVQGFRSDHQLERKGGSYRFVAGEFAPQLSRWRIPRRLHALVRELDPDVVHLNGLGFFLQARDLRARLRSGTVIVAQHHAEKPSVGVSAVFQRRGLRAVDGFFFTGREMATPWYRGGFVHPRQRVFEVLEGSTDFRLLDRSASRESTGLVGDPVCIWVANLTANKDPLTVLDGFAKLLRTHAGARLYMAYRGDDLLPAVERRIDRDASLREAVRLLGNVPHDDLELLLNSADLFVQGSHYEGSGYGLIEAIACGVVPVVTDIPSFRFITAEARVGSLWQTGDSDSFAAALVEQSTSLLDRPREMREFFDRRLAYSVIGEQAMAAYDQLCGRSCSGAVARSGSIESAPSVDYLCPSCRRPLDPATWACSEGHLFGMRDGVLDLIDPELRPRLDRFLATLRSDRDRRGKRILGEDRYQGLPWSEGDDFEWRFRCHDLELLFPLIVGRRRPRVLDVGSYNGWLARNLVDGGCDVTGVDYFDDPYDGLGARRWYSQARWSSVQLDLRDLSIIDRRFDLVVLNRCLQFFPDPRDYFEQAKQRVAPGGLLVATGLDLYRNARRKERLIEVQRDRYRTRHGIDCFLHPTRGLLDFGDRRALSAAGLVIREYPQLWRRNLMSRCIPNRPRFCYGVWRAPNPPKESIE